MSTLARVCRIWPGEWCGFCRGTESSPTWSRRRALLRGASAMSVSGLLDAIPEERSHERDEDNRGRGPIVS